MRRVPLRIFARAPLNGTAAIESGVLDLRRFSPGVGLLVTATSIAGIPDVKLEIAYSDDGVNFGAYDDTAPLLGSTLSAFGATPEGTHQLGYTFGAAPYAKIRATGNAGNPADAILSLTAHASEEL